MADRRRPSLESALNKLLKLAEEPNLALTLEDTQLNEIGLTVKREFDIDKHSREEWERAANKAMDAALQVRKPKNWPFEKAANVKFPILTTAAIQFGSRAYPAIVDGPMIVKGQVVGRDEDGAKRAAADRVAAHMSWQLLVQMEEWEEDTDVLLHHLPIIGSVFRKVYRSEELQRCKSEMVPAIYLVINQSARSIESAPRITHELHYYPYEIAEFIASETWIDADLPDETSMDGDVDALVPFLEQHRRLDLDDDGYAEPYIVTVHRDTGKVVRIVANYGPKSIRVSDKGRIVRIEPKDYFVHYPFLPDPKGGFYGVGFGHLLESITDTIDTTINQMLDAGTLQNAGGGFIGSNVRFTHNSGVVRFSPGEYKTVSSTGGDIKNAIVNMEHPGPSPVLFQLLGMMVEAANNITAVKDLMTGDTGGKQMQPTTALALIEQGLKVFTAIYKRIYRSLNKEFKLLFDLNSEYLNDQEYFSFAGQQMQVSNADYNPDSLSVNPVADPRLVTDMQRLTRAQILMQFAQDPMVNPVVIRRRYLEAAGIDGIDEVMKPLQQIMQEMQAAAAQAQEVQAAEMGNKKAQTLKTMAEAEHTMASTPHPAQQAMQQMGEAQGVIPGAPDAPVPEMAQ